jgi:large subunit ribosomal protein L30
MKAIIRITGKVNMRQKAEENLSRLRLRRKYACVVIDDSKKETAGRIKSARNFIAYGEIGKETLIKLIEKRGQPIEKGKKIDAKKIAEEIIKNKSMKDLEIKPFFRLHPPRKGINSRQHYPKGVLGDNKEKINELIERML